MKQREYRETRVDLFNKFNDITFLSPIFEEFKNEPGKHHKFLDYNNLNICPKGRCGGLNKRLLEVFYGYSIYDKVDSISSSGAINSKVETEYGVTLSFNLNDHGYVAVILLPSGTETTKAFESCIFVKNYLHPKKLLKKSLLKKLWRYFNSYMECTSINGEANVIDRLRFFYLRNFKNCCIDNKYQMKKVVVWIKNVLDWILKVGLSGAVIYLVTK